MVTLELRGADELLQRLRASPGKLRTNLRTAMERLTLEAQVGTQAKVEGPVLHHRTGNLVSNITRVTEVQGDTVIGTVGIGRNAWYGKLHELGFNGIGQRRNLKHPAHSVRRKDGTTATTGSPYSIHIPARPFVGPTIDAMRERIRERLLQAIQESF